MQFLCKHKIGIHSATPSHSYPVIRLPREFAPLAGETVSIYQTGNDGKLEFIISVDKNVDKVCANLERSQVETRLAALETEISELKSLLLSNEGDNLHKNKKEDKFNGLGRIRTGDLRHVKARFFDVSI